MRICFPCHFARDAESSNNDENSEKVHWISHLIQNDSILSSDNLAPA